MGNLSCSAEEAARLASIARDICPFPSYEPSPHFFNMLSMNSSRHLGEHYVAVQASLTPGQLAAFTRGLRTTFGREGKVTHGGVGVVALSLAVLFDTLAGQVRGEWGPETGPVPGLFLRDRRGKYPQFVNTASDYLRLVPHIANNPARMRVEAERCLRQLLLDERSPDTAAGNDLTNYGEDVMGVNSVLGQFFQSAVRLHLTCLINSTDSTLVDEMMPKCCSSSPKGRRDTEAGVGSTFAAKIRKRRLPAPDEKVEFTLNCDAQRASKEFLAEVQKSDNQTQTAFKSCQTFNGRIPKTWIHYIASLAWLDVVNHPVLGEEEQQRVVEKSVGLIAQREDFDLKANAFGTW